MTDRIEDELRARGRALEGPALSPERAQRVREQLVEMARAEARATSGSTPVAPARGRLLRFAVAAAASVALVLFLMWRDGGPRTFGATEVEVAWLDGMARPLESAVRSGTGQAPRRPEELRVEIEAAGAGFLAVVLYDAGGEREFPVRVTFDVPPDEPLGFTIPLDEAPPQGAAEVVVGGLVLASLVEIPATTLEQAAPASIGIGDPALFEAELAALASALEQRLGCSVVSRSFRFRAE